uniref:Tetraspanin n=1 Tax=Syphacia muris TaxID=451379 RepID=A0A0N5AIE7_9BILA
MFKFLAGLTLLGLGVGLRLEPSLIQYLKQHDSNYYVIEIASYAIIAAGICLTIVGFLGCCGAWFLNQTMLVLYFIILMIILGMEMTAAVMIHMNKDHYRKTVDRELLTMIQREYLTNPQKAAIVDEIQTSLQCCGVKSFNDWIASTYSTNDPDSSEVGIGALEIGRVPKSCCNEVGLIEYPGTCGIGFTRQPLATYSRFLYEQVLV